MIRWIFGQLERKMMSIGQTDGFGVTKSADWGPDGHGGQKDYQRFQNQG